MPHYTKRKNRYAWHYSEIGGGGYVAGIQKEGGLNHFQSNPKILIESVIVWGEKLEMCCEQ